MYIPGIYLYTSALEYTRYRYTTTQMRTGGRDDNGLSAYTALLNRRCRDDLQSFMNERFAGGSSGSLAIGAVEAYLKSNLVDVLEEILDWLKVREETSLMIARRLKEHWSPELCASMYLQSDMSDEAYQACLNICCKQYDEATETYVPLELWPGVFCPKWSSRHRVKQEINNMAEMKGINHLEGGQCVVMDAEMILGEQIEHAVGSGPVPESIVTQIVADAANWQNRPQNKVMLFVLLLMTYHDCYYSHAFSWYDTITIACYYDVFSRTPFTTCALTSLL